MANSDPAALGAVRARDAIRRGELTSEALVTACLRRIAEREPAIQAWARLDAEGALAQARAADRAREAGRPLGILHGVPVGVKDIVDTADLPTENGSPIFAGRRPEQDAAVVVALKRAGAVILGKTVTTELAFFSPGKTRNPVNTEHTPGGSSSGSAAAVADFHVPLALGTQTAGSILRPASFCGVIGFKPTFGLVPRDGVLAQSAPLDTIGGFARAVEDVALLMECLTEDTPGPPLAAARGVRFAFVRSPAWPRGEASMKEAFRAFVSRLGPAAVETEDPPAFADGLEAQRQVQFRDIARNYGPLLDAHPGQISAKLAETIAEGRAVTDAQYAAALALREPLYAALQKILEGYDAILTPAAAGPAPRGTASTGSPSFNALWTYLGAPAISLPLLEADGLPLGAQLVGRRGHDRELLEAANELCRLSPMGGVK